MSNIISVEHKQVKSNTENALENEDFKRDFDSDFTNYYILHDKNYKKYFRITNTKLINDYPDIFKKKNSLIYISPDKIEEAKDLILNKLNKYQPNIDDAKKYKIKSNYILKTTGEEKEYINDVKYLYTPKVKKFDFLRSNESIMKIINSNDEVKVIDKVRMIYDILTDDEKKNICMSSLSNFVYRESYKK